MKKHYNRIFWVIVLAVIAVLFVSPAYSQDTLIYCDPSSRTWKSDGKHYEKYSSVCDTRSHVHPGVETTTLSHCPPFVKDSECYTIKVYPGCITRLWVCLRCNERITETDPTVQDTVWINPGCRDSLGKFWTYFDSSPVTMDDIIGMCQETGRVPTYRELVDAVGRYNGYVPLWMDENGRLYYDPDGEYWSDMIEVLKLIESKEHD